MGYVTLKSQVSYTGACYTKVIGQLHWGHVIPRSQVSYTGACSLRSQVSYTGACYTKVIGQLHWGHVTHSGHRSATLGACYTLRSQVSYTEGMLH